jgi:hypothetical protein
LAISIFRVKKTYYKDESSRYLSNAVSCIPNYTFFYLKMEAGFLWHVGTYLPSYTILYSEDRGSRLLKNVDTHLPTYKTSHSTLPPKRWRQLVPPKCW